MTKHIKETLAPKLRLTEWEIDLLCYIRRQRNKNDLFIVSIPSVSSSGMSRKMKFAINKNGELIRVTHLFAKVLKKKFLDDDTIRVQGCGMDMVFATIDRFLAELGIDRAYKCKSTNQYFLL